MCRRSGGGGGGSGSPACRGMRNSHPSRHYVSAYERAPGLVSDPWRRSSISKSPSPGGSSAGRSNGQRRSICRHWDAQPCAGRCDSACGSPSPRQLLPGASRRKAALGRPSAESPTAGRPVLEAGRLGAAAAKARSGGPGSGCRQLRWIAEAVQGRNRPAADSVEGASPTPQQKRIRGHRAMNRWSVSESTSGCEDVRRIRLWLLFFLIKTKWRRTHKTQQSFDPGGDRYAVDESSQHPGASPPAPSCCGKIERSAPFAAVLLTAHPLGSAARMRVKEGRGEGTYHGMRRMRRMRRTASSSQACSHPQRRVSSSGAAASSARSSDAGRHERRTSAARSMAQLDKILRRPCEEIDVLLRSSRRHVSSISACSSRSKRTV